MSSTPTGSYPTFIWTTPSPPVLGEDACYNPVTKANDIPVGTEAGSECESYICTVHGWALLNYKEYCCIFNENSFPGGTELTIMKKDGPCDVVCAWNGSMYDWMKMDYMPLKRKEAKGKSSGAKNN